MTTGTRWGRTVGCGCTVSGPQKVRQDTAMTLTIKKTRTKKKKSEAEIYRAIINSRVATVH